MRQIYFQVFTIILSALALQGNAAIRNGSVSVGSGANQIDLTISVNDVTNIVSMEMTGPSGKYFGFGFGTTYMQNGSYTLLGNVSGNPVAEYSMVFHAAPTIQSTQNLSNIITSTPAAGRVRYTFTRALNTADPNDLVFTISLSSIPLIWAYGSSTSLSYHGSSKGTATINLTDPCANVPLTTLPVNRICAGDSSLIFGQYRSVAGDYFDTLSTALGCDSIVKQSLAIINDQVVNLPPVQICQGDSALIFGQYISTSGIYSDTLSSSLGCDSIVVLTLSLITIDTSLIVNGLSISANASPATYQWIDCTSGQPIAGANGMTYTPTANGTYAVMITQNACTLRSSCVTINGVGLPETVISGVPGIFPNPGRDQIQINLNGSPLSTGSTLTVYDMQGRLMLVTDIQNETETGFDASSLAPGLYSVLIISAGKQYNTLFVRD